MSGHKDTWRVFKIISEFVEGFETMNDVERAISVFGSARCKPGDKYYNEAVEIGKEIAKSGYDIITGGGPGIMEAASKGGQLGGGRTIGLNIELPKEAGNEYLDISVAFHYFFVRKVMFKKYSSGIIVCPGGFGTLDEMFEVLTLIQTRKTKWSPVVLFGSEYWKGLLDFVRGTLVTHKYVDKNDLDLIKLSDDPAEAVSLITEVLKADEEARKSLVDLEE
jgi:uncharacterized protein (TIGR00730 family)